MKRNKCPPHHYVLPTPEGATSEGVCKKCHERKTFSNFYKWTDKQKDGSHKFPMIRLAGR